MTSQHHSLLLFGWKINQGIMNHTSTQILRQYVLYFYEKHLSGHLQNEERILLSALGEKDPCGQKMAFVHDTIRHQMQEIRSNDTVPKESFQRFCQLLMQLVRYEESKLIPHLEDTLSGWKLSQIQYLLKATDQPFEDTFSPLFWQDPATGPDRESCV